MKNYEQLISVDKTAELTREEREFLEVHRRIISCGEFAGRALFEMCMLIKRMKDEKLYLVAGFEKFEDYSEQALNVGLRQAYRYIKVAETYSEKFIVENGKLGITKLALLASVTEEEREDIIETIDVAEANKEDVEAAVKAAIRERDEVKKQLEDYADKNAELEDRLSESESDYAELTKDFNNKEMELREAKEQAKNLKQEALDLEKKLTEAKKAAKEVKTVPDEESKRLAEAEKARADELEQKLREVNAQLATAQEQKKTIASDDLLVFKVKFEDIQKAWSELNSIIAKMDKETADKCKNAIKAVLASWSEVLA